MTTQTDIQRSQYSEAVALAARAHSGQMDDDGQPHLAHVLRVAEAVPDHLKAAAALHDVLEDTGVTLDELYEAITGRDATIVVLLTRRDDETYAEYIQRIWDEDGALGSAARTIKQADLVDNLTRSLSEGNWSRVRRYTRAIGKLADRYEGGS